jgi:phospholipase/carboxylesterase
LSDGATYTLRCGLQPDSPFTALAPVSGVLPPDALLAARATIAGRRLYLVHGALDWMFPVETARAARDALSAAGADLTFREIGDLSHTYPREENAKILAWFDPSLTPA